MSKKLSDHELDALWRRAQERLDLVDSEPPVSMADVDKLLTVLGKRPANQSVTDWLKSATRKSTPVADPVSAVIVPFDRLKQQFTPVVEFVRLAADDAGREIPLPGGPLEDELGKFRLKIARDNNQLVIKVTALGQASEDYANCKVGLATTGREPVAILALDEDGDGEIRLLDTTDLRLLLLKPVIGIVEDI